MLTDREVHSIQRHTAEWLDLYEESRDAVGEDETDQYRRELIEAIAPVEGKSESPWSSTGIAVLMALVLGGAGVLTRLPPLVWGAWAVLAVGLLLPVQSYFEQKKQARFSVEQRGVVLDALHGAGKLTNDEVLGARKRLERMASRRRDAS